MANAAANIAQKHMGEVPVSVANQDKENKSSDEMLACCWVGKDKLEMRKVPRPAVTDDEDVILKVTGSTG
jgi:hypothetical protein